MRTACTLLLALVVAACGAGAAAVPAPTATLTDIGAGLQGPAGLAATTYATGLGHVSAFSFDAGGRLWAATAGYDDDGTDAVYLVASAGAAPTRVIADLHTPLGLALGWRHAVRRVRGSGRGLLGVRWHGVREPPHGPGAARTASARSTASSSRPDGRFVLGVSAPCDACTPTSPYAAAVVSFLPDGSDLRVEASGIRAPVGLAYIPGTADLLVTMNQRDDLGTSTPGDWLSLVRSGQAWGFPACYGQGGSACDGVPQPIATLDAHAAVSGVAIVKDFGSSPGSSAIVAEWAKGVVLRVALTAQGDSYRGTVEPFLTGLTNPVPVATAPDGALLVGDWGTGTVYRVAPA